MRAEHTVTALHYLRKPLNIQEQGSGPMPWQSRFVQPDTELLAIGTSKGALYIFDWQGRLLLDLQQAIAGMALLVSRSLHALASIAFMDPSCSSHSVDQSSLLEWQCQTID